MADETPDYTKLAERWRKDHSLANFLDIKVTASQGGSSKYTKLAMFLQHAESLLAEQPSEVLNKDRRGTLQQIKDSLDSMREGITSWSQFDEDYLTLLVMSALSGAPHHLALFPALREWGLLSEDPSTPAISVGWPQLSPATLDELGLKELPARVTPDWLIETPHELIFFEFKRPDQRVPVQGEALKFGRMIVLGDRLAQIGCKRFVIAAMASEGERKVKLTPGGTMSLTEAVSVAIDVTVSNGAKLHRTKEQIATAVVPFTWSQVRATVASIATQLQAAAASDVWGAGQYGPALVRMREQLEQALHLAAAGKRL